MTRSAAAPRRGRADVVETEHDAARNVAEWLGVARCLAGYVPSGLIAVCSSQRVDAA